jgi:hypothetical protein
MEECVCFLQDTRRIHPTWNLGIDPVVMRNVAQSAMDDIWRYKVFHLDESPKPALSDAVKRAAYLTKWLLKLRPIYCVRPLRAEQFKRAFDKNDNTLLINEAFSLWISSATIATDANVEKLVLMPDFMASILYDFHFRQMNDDALLAIYQMVRDIAGERRLVETSRA